MVTNTFNDTQTIRLDLATVAMIMAALVYALQECSPEEAFDAANELVAVGVAKGREAKQRLKNDRAVARFG